MAVTEQTLNKAYRQTTSNAGNEVILRVDKLNKTFSGHTVLRDVSLKLRRGDVVLLRGDNGSGKTTLLNILAGNVEPDSGQIEYFANGNQVEFDFPRPWFRVINLFDRFAPEYLASKGVGRTWQDIRLFATQKLRDNIVVAAPNQLGETLLGCTVKRSAAIRQETRLQNEAELTLSSLNLVGRGDSSADKISLGQTKRVAIARAVHAGAKVLFLDEPLAGLDAEGVKEVLDLLRKLVEEDQITLVIVEHLLNIPLLARLATDVWTLQDGTLKQSNVSILSASGEGETEYYGNHILHWISDAIGGHTQAVRYELQRGAALTVFTSALSVEDTPVLDINGLVVKRGKRTVIGWPGQEGRLNGISIVLNKGEVAVLEAPNGWGKTTLLEAIAGLLPLDEGTIKIGGVSSEQLPAWKRSRLGLIFFQAHNKLFGSLSVEEALRLCNVSEPSHALLTLLRRDTSNLSGGERQKLAMDCVFAKAGCVWMLDEPLSALDAEGLSALEKRLQSRGDATLLIAIPSTVNET